MESMFCIVFRGKNDWEKKAFVWRQGCIFHSFRNQLEKVLIAEVEKCNESTKLVQTRNETSIRVCGAT